MLVELLERAVDVERIKLVARHPVGEQREDYAARRVADAQAAGAGKFLDVPEIRPRSRAAVGKLVAAIAEIGALNIRRDAVAVGDDRVRAAARPC